MKTKFRLLLLAALLTGATIQSAAAQCFFYCWHVSPEETCCRTRTCAIVCG